ncbi:MAG: hypothetical protein OXM61_08445 [Candidatus Poribacteria bacterium]|nr:hypothetical protein [Candidatus Poribacteria bacterium]
MKNVLIIALLLVLILFTLNGYTEDYMKWGLPENATLRLGKGSINDLKHSPNGDLIAVATSIGVWLYDADSGKEIRLLQNKKHNQIYSDWIIKLAFSPNGKILAICALDGIHLWEPHTGRYLSILREEPHLPGDLVFFPDGQTLATSTRTGGLIKLWDVANRTISKTLTTDTGGFGRLSIAVSPNGETIVSGPSFQSNLPKSNKIRWWDVETGRTFYSINVDRDVSAIAFSPDGNMLAYADTFGAKIHLLDGVSGETLRTLRGHEDIINALTFSPNGELLASSGWDNIIHLWDPRSGHLIHTFRGHTDAVTTLSFSLDGETLVSGSEDGTIRFWNASTKQQRLSISGHWGEVEALAFSNDGKTLVSGIPHATIHKWNIETGQLTSTLTGRYGEQILAFSMKNGLFVKNGLYAIKSPYYLEDDVKIYFRSIDTGQSLRSIDAVKLLYKEKATFSHDGKTLVLSPGKIEKGKVKFWDTLSNRFEFEFVPHENPEVSKYKLFHHEGVTALASSPDGNLLAIALDEKVSLWKFGTNKFIRLYDDPVWPIYLKGQALAFSNNSKTLACAHNSMEIYLIEVDTGNLITTLSKPYSGVNALAFSPNDKILASGSQDGTILIWDLDKAMKKQ